LKEKYAGWIADVRIDWHGSSAGLSFLLLRPLRLRITADLTIKPDEVALEGRLPFVAWAFRRQIETVIGDQLRACLA
jgi:hypothetical protein